MAFLKTVPSCVIGIDYSRDTLVLCERGKQTVQVIANAFRPIRHLLARQMHWWCQSPRVVMRPCWSVSYARRRLHATVLTN